MFEWAKWLLFIVLYVLLCGGFGFFDHEGEDHHHLPKVEKTHKERFGKRGRKVEKVV